MAKLLTPLLLCCVVLVACGDSAAPAADAGGIPDLGSDSGQHVADAASDGGVEAGSDAGQDAGADLQGADLGPRPVWFLHLTDVHIGASSFASYALSTAVQHIAPAVSPTATLVTGDLTDDGSAAQFTSYRGLIQGKVPAPPLYLEIVGNHDVKADDGKTFLAGTPTGQATGDLYGISYIDAAQGRIQVVRTNTVDSNNPVKQLTGYVSEAQVQGLQGEPPSPTPVEHRVVLGHHPIEGIQGLKVLGTDGRMKTLLTHFSAEVYLCGHAHLAKISWYQQTLKVQTLTLGKPEITAPDPGFAVVALDETGPAARMFKITKSNPVVVGWPLVLITTPADVELGGTNPLAQPLPIASPLVVRALAMAPGGVQSVEARLDAGNWVALGAAGPPLYQGQLVPPMVAGQHTLEVRAVSSQGTGSHAISVQFGP